MVNGTVNQWMDSGSYSWQCVETVVRDGRE